MEVAGWIQGSLSLSRLYPHIRMQDQRHARAEIAAEQAQAAL